MNNGQQDETDKSFEPTPQKLEQARRKGDIPRSTDLLTAVGYLGFTLAFVTMGPFIIEHVGAPLSFFIANAHELSTVVFAGSPQPILGGFFRDVAYGISPVFVTPALAVILTIVAMRGFLLTPSKLQPKLSRISIIENAKHKFGRSGLFEFGKSFVKLLVYSVCLAIFLQMNLPDMISGIEGDPRLVVRGLAEFCLSFLFVVVVISALIGAIDVLFQYQEHMRKNMMSRKEIMDETKEAEGDPHMKQQRRSRAMAIAQAQMMADVPRADVVVVNPTHYAVALSWDRAPGTAPVCVAKGVDEIALRIREIGQENGIPIHSDPPTARALHSLVEIGEEIGTEHYQAVAAAIRFADEMRERARKGV